MEFALVLPIVLLLALGLIDFGRTLQAYTIVANAAREGSRSAIIAGHNDSAVVAAVQSASVPLDIPAGDVRVNRSATSVTVAVTATVAPVTPLLGRAVGGAIRVVGISSEPTQ